MQRVRVAIIGAGAATEWALLPALSGPDAVAPPDTGAWWSRRPALAGDIRYQAPARPEVVALSDANAKRAAEVARAARVPGVYADWRQMLREVTPDAVFWPAGDEGNPKSEIGRPESVEVVRALAGAGTRWLWLEGLPARSAQGLELLSLALAGRNLHLWPAAPLRHAAAHRAARRLIERGAITALQLRWPFPFDDAHFGASYAALDLVLSFLPGGAGTPRCVMAGQREGNASLWLNFSSGATATLLFGAADAWNAPLPRLEITGTQGRFLICEAGRRLSHFVPREAARHWEPPGLAPHVSAPGVAGVAEDVKAFLAACAGTAPLLGAETALFEPARALTLLEAARRSLESGELESVAARSFASVEALPIETEARPLAAPENLTLQLS